MLALWERIPKIWLARPPVEAIIAQSNNATNAKGDTTMNVRLTVPLLLSTLLAGCDLMSAISTPATDKINAAFPPPPELLVAQKSLQSALQGTPATQQAQAELYAQRMLERAQTCTATYSIGRLDTVSGIRGKVDNASCFTTLDAALAEWIGLQHLALVLAKPALVPYAELPAKTMLPDPGEPAGMVATATGANVMVVKTAQRFTAVELPGGKPINGFPVPELSFKPAALSANGRVLAVPLGSRNLRLFEVETGAVLWDTQAYAGLLAWLPQHNAALLTQSNTGLPYLLDLNRRRIEPFPATEKQLAWALPTPAAGGQYLVGSSVTVSLVDLQREGSGRLAATPVKQWRLPENRSIQPGALWLANQGKRLLYQTDQTLGWLDLQTDQQGAWEFAALGAQGFAKLDEQQVVFNRSGAEGAVTPWALDIGRDTVGALQEADEGLVLPLLPRAGYLQRGKAGTAVGAATATNDAQPLAQVVAAAQRAQRNGPARAAQGAPAAKPLLTEISAQARVSVVGVHDSVGSTRISSSNWQPGKVTINVQPGTTPLVLVLSSQEPVKWLVHSNGRKIEAVLISGYQDSNVYGTGDTQVHKIGPRAVYRMDSPDYEPLKRDIARFVANPVLSFQGSYRGQSFSVN